MRKRMGWRGRERGRYPGNVPFRDLPPWQRPRKAHSYGREYGVGYGGVGYGRGLGYGRDYGYYGSTSPYSCARFPWLPRWWWADPKFQGGVPYPPTPDPQAELERLQAEREILAKDIDEMKRHVEQGTAPSTWPRSAPYYGGVPYTASPEQEKQFLEEQMGAITSQMEAMKKRLQELEKGE